MQVDPRPLRCCGVIPLTLTVLAALHVGIAPSAHAQGQPAPPTPSLDTVMVNLLSFNCFALGFDISDPWGPNLARICDVPSTGAGNSTGGGAASPQASTLSMQNSVIQERMERAKRKKQQASSPAASATARGRSGSARLKDSDAPGESGTPSTGSRFDIFASGSYESLDRDVTPFEDGYDSSIVGGAFGFDYQFNDTVVAGFVAGYRKQDADFRGGGNFEMSALEPSVYALVLPSPRTFLQFCAGYGGQNSDVNRRVHFDVDEGGTPRNIDGTAASAADSKAYNASALFGFDQPAGRFTFGPRAGVNYAKTKIDPYEETGGTGLELRLNGRTVESLQAVVAFYGSAAFSTKHGVVVPQLNLRYVHEFEDDPSVLSAQFAEDLRGPTAVTFGYRTNTPDADYFNADAGVAVMFARGVQFFVNLRTMFGNNTFESSAGTIGVRFEL